MRRLVLACSWASAAGCVTETGNPEFEPDRELTARARSSDPARVVVEPPPESGDGGDVVLEAVVTMREIRLESAEDCASGGTVESEIEGPWTVDLVGAPDALPVTLADVGYCRLRLRLDRGDDDRSVVIRGERADGVPFRIESRANPDLEIRSDDGPFRLDPAGSGLVLAFDLATWLEDLGLGDLQPGDGGEIRIDEEENRDALDRFEDAVERSLELFEDLDGDRAVDPGEEPLLAAG